MPKSVCNDFHQSSQLEWLQTNHTGAFAMGTVAGVNTRRYHGLLIATLNPPADRYSVVPRVEETVTCAAESFPLATVQYPGIVSPAGYNLLEAFTALPYPSWRYRCGTVLVEKSLRLVEREQTVILSYTADAECELQIRLFVSVRDYHSLGQQNNALRTAVNQEPGCLSMRPYDHLPVLTFYHSATSFEASSAWFKNHEYLRELERGLDYREDLYSPGVLHFQLTPSAPVQLTATIESKPPSMQTPRESPTTLLTAALDQFRVTRADNKPTLIAGYPWFTDWSRDILISLPALTASGFDPAETRAILEFLLNERKQGLLPNRFSDRHSSPEYNTVDASLWFFIAADAYLSYAPDPSFLRDTLLPSALDIIDWHKRGTFYGIQVDASDGLLSAGEPGTQLTWMDAKIGDYVVTPRMGKPVEINALWFNALQITSGWASQVGDLNQASALAAEAAEVKNSFLEKFWNAQRSCLYDVLTTDGPDASLRPNQLFALSLPYPLLDRDKAKSLIAVIGETLLTPAGIRTLEPSDSRYRSHFDGDMRSRDSAYHQGTVWPWLIGPFIHAYLYAFEDNPQAISYCRSLVDSILELTGIYCLGTIGEVFDGDAPHHPGGCPSQLWSVAQVILALKRLDQT